MSEHVVHQKQKFFFLYLILFLSLTLPSVSLVLSVFSLCRRMAQTPTHAHARAIHQGLPKCPGRMCPPRPLSPWLLPSPSTLKAVTRRGSLHHGLLTCPTSVRCAINRAVGTASWKCILEFCVDMQSRGIHWLVGSLMLSSVGPSNGPFSNTCWRTLAQY